MRDARRLIKLTEEATAKVITDVKASGCLGRSKRQVLLFEYLLKKSISEASEDVSQYAIAVDVLGRSEAFDPGNDSIVRVEMHRLRANLKAYSAENSDYSITVPPGIFRVVIKSKKNGSMAKFGRNPIWHIGAIGCVAAIFMLGYFTSYVSKDRTSVTLNHMCSETLPNIRVINTGDRTDAQIYIEKTILSTASQQTRFELLFEGQNCDQDAAPVFDLEYSLVENNNELSVAMTVYSQGTGIVASRNLSTRSLNDEMDDSWAFKITRTLNEVLRPSGIVARSALAAEWPSPENRENYKCVIMMYDSFSGDVENSFGDVNQCLEDSLNTEVPHLDNYGALAASHLDQARRTSGAESDVYFERARDTLENVENLWPESVELSIARIYYELQREDSNLERFHKTLIDVESRFNSNPHILITVSYFTGYTLGDWQRAKEISDRVKKIYPVRDQSVFVVDAAYAIMKSENDTLLTECVKFYAENSISTNILINACARQTQNSEWVVLTETNLSRMKHESLESRLQVLDQLNYHLDLKKRVTEYLSIELDESRIKDVYSNKH